MFTRHVVGLVTLGAIAAVSAAMPAHALCKRDNPCIPDPSDPKLESTSGKLHLKYMVLTVVYAPPGSGSQVTYGQYSTSGTTTTVGSSVSDKLSVSVGGTVSLDQSWAETSGQSNSVQLKKTAGNTISIKTAKDKDKLNHGNDRFYLWLNPVMDVTFTGYKDQKMPKDMKYTVDKDGPMDVVDVTADELLGNTTPPDWKKTKLAKLSKSDVHQILEQDPFVFNKPLDRHRFVPLAGVSNSLQIEGPDYPDADNVGAGLEISDESTTTQTDSSSSAYSVGFTVSGGFSFFDIVKVSVKVSDSWTFTNTNSIGKSYGSLQKATVMLWSNTVGYHDVVDVYEDTIYHTFAFVSRTDGNGIPVQNASVSGKMVDHAGNPMKNQIVTVNFANGKARRVVTNKQGIYRVFDAPAGPTRFSAAGIDRELLVTPGRPIVNDFKLTNPVR